MRPSASVKACCSDLFPTEREVCVSSPHVLSVLASIRPKRPMLKSLHINRFRSCVDVRLVDLTEVTALVGRNGAGKTNILQALAWLGQHVTADRPRSTDVEDGKMSVEFSLRGENFWYSVNKSSRQILGSSRGEHEAIIEEELTKINADGEEKLVHRNGERVELVPSGQTVLLSDESSAIFSLIALLPKSDPLRSTLVGIWAFFTEIAYYPLSDVTGPEDVAVIFAPDFKKWSSNIFRSQQTDAVSTVMRIIGMSIDDEATLEELKSILGEDQLNLVSDISVVALPTRPHEPEPEKSNSIAYFVEFTPAAHTASFSFDKLSFGTKRIVQLVVSMLSDRSRIALIEQPEDGIHPALLHKLIPLLRAYTTDDQIIIASHSPAVLNRLEPSEIRIIEMANGRTYARSLSDLEMGAARNYLADEGPLADFIDSL